MRVTFFEVKGATYFPITLLAFESAWPAWHEDAEKIDPGPAGINKERTVKLCTINDLPRPDMWKDWGWEVTSVWHAKQPRTRSTP